jgi:hypothetical protein
VFSLETNTIVELCDMTFDETAPYPRDVFECAGDKKIEHSIFVNEELHDFDDDEDDPLHPFISSLEHVTVSTLEAEPPRATTSFTPAVEASQV